MGSFWTISRDSCATPSCSALWQSVMAEIRDSWNGSSCMCSGSSLMTSLPLCQQNVTKGIARDHGFQFWRNVGIVFLPKWRRRPVWKCRGLKRQGVTSLAFAWYLETSPTIFMSKYRLESMGQENSEWKQSGPYGQSCHLTFKQSVTSW